jgi:hypothetical protein
VRAARQVVVTVRTRRSPPGARCVRGHVDPRTVQGAISVSGRQSPDRVSGGSLRVPVPVLTRASKPTHLSQSVPCDERGGTARLPELRFESAWPPPDGRLADALAAQLGLRGLVNRRVRRRDPDGDEE